ncbi:sensor histidine kinase [Dactylosporangium sp. CA-092794]|uniref:sensor histidine kinase n=1 Tax=Dactylosporangium sp. CA-092794 TaxID=3239929 RepID=UPI003D94CC12
MRTGLRSAAVAMAIAVAVLGVRGGWGAWELTCFVLTGVLHTEVGQRMWRARPDSRMGPLMLAAGLCWLADGAGRVAVPWLFRDGLMLGAVYQPLVLHCALVIPVGRLQGRLDRATALAGYLFWPAVLLGWWLTPGHPAGIGGLLEVRAVAYPVVGAGLLLFLLRRYRVASPLYRAAYTPFWVANLVNVAATAVVSSEWYVGGSLPQIVYYAGSAAIPVGAALSLARSQPPPPAIRSLVAALGADPAGPAGLRDALRAGLGDPTLEVLSPADLGRLGGRRPPGAALTPLRHGGRDVGALVHDPALAAAPDVFHAVLRMAALVLDNSHQLDEVLRSRRRLVEAADAERRRIERNIHDGVQQRLIAASLLLRQAQRAGGGEGSGAALLDQGLSELNTAVNELREIARGMNPPALVIHGLAGALESIAERSRVAVDVDDRVGATEIGEETAVTAYYVALEAVTNAEKHGGDGGVELRLTTVDGRLLVSVRDSGAGGAAFVPGGGLEGLRDRVEACGGRLSLSSPPGGGTLLAARLPLNVANAEEDAR